MLLKFTLLKDGTYEFNIKDFDSDHEEEGSIEEILSFLRNENDMSSFLNDNLSQNGVHSSLNSVFHCKNSDKNISVLKIENCYDAVSIFGMLNNLGDRVKLRDISFNNFRLSQSGDKEDEMKDKARIFFDFLEKNKGDLKKINIDLDDTQVVLFDSTKEFKIFEEFWTFREGAGKLPEFEQCNICLKSQDFEFKIGKSVAEEVRAGAASAAAAAPAPASYAQPAQARVGTQYCYEPAAKRLKGEEGHNPSP